MRAYHNQMPGPDKPINGNIRHDWSVDEIEEIYRSPLLELLGRACAVHRDHFDPARIQKASLLSIKTGGCPEDCAYCPQSAHHREVTLGKEQLFDPASVIEMAERAKNAGADRFCMGAAWRRVRDGAAFDAVLEMVRGVKGLGMEACVTLGMLEPHHARQLKDAGLTAYNHNLDTSPEFYSQIITTRTYQHRLDTLAAVRSQGIDLCCGGIIGMGETIRDRASMLHVLAGFDPHPESVPINALVPVAGTPLANLEQVDPLELVRMVATARITMPASMVRLSAGRTNLNREAQIMCLMAGANSVFYGEKLLTTPNPEEDSDTALFNALGPIAA